MAGIAEVGLAKQQLIADIHDIGAVAHQLEIPTAVYGVAVQYRPLDAVVLQHQFLVDALVGILEDDFLTLLVAVELAGGEQIDAGHLELGGGHHALVAGIAQLRQVVGADLGHLEQGRHQAIGLAAVLDAFPHGIDARVVGLHGVVDQHAALAIEAGLLGQFDIGADAHRHHHEVRWNLGAVLEAHGAHLLLAEYGLGLGLHEEGQAFLLQGTFQQVPRRLVQLTFHEGVHEMHHGHRHAPLLETVGGLQTQQAAADHHRPPAAACGLEHGIDVMDVAEGDHSLQILARHRDDERPRAGGQHQAIVGFHCAITGHHPATATVDLHHLLAGMERDAVVPVPLEIVEHDVFQGLLAGQHRGEKNAVVVAEGFGAKDGDLIHIGGELEQLLQGAHPGHAISDQYQLFFHRLLTPLGCRFVSDDSLSARAVPTAHNKHKMLFMHYFLYAP